MRSTSTSRRKAATPGRGRPARRGDGAHPSGRNACAPAGFPVIAMAASAGGLKALSVILGGLPADFPAAIAIVMHLAPDHKSILAEILSRRTHLVVKQAHTGDILCLACVFVAPPNQHLFVAGGGRLKLSSSAAEKVHYARPSAEPLFASVAEVYKQNAIAVVLTGGDGDGSFGVQIIKDEGGQVIAQDRPTSEDFSMPKISIETGDVDFVLPLDEIAPKLIELVAAGGGQKNWEHSRPGCSSARPRAEHKRADQHQTVLLAVRSGQTARARPAAPEAGAIPQPTEKTPAPALAKAVTPRYSARTKAATIQRKK